MAQKSPETPLTQRMRSIDDPTAAFPIGALQGIVKALEDEESDWSDVSDVSDDAPGTIRPVWLLLALVVGGVVAIGMVSVIAVFVFLM